jgi:hypothetical protein
MHGEDGGSRAGVAGFILAVAGDGEDAVVVALQDLGGQVNLEEKFPCPSSVKFPPGMAAPLLSATE